MFGNDDLKEGLYARALPFVLEASMRYHHTKPDLYLNRYGRIYICDHPVYSRCTLFEIGDKGLAVIQQRFDVVQKTTWWTEIDPWLTDSIYLHPSFHNFFEERAKPNTNGIFPTITIRQLMWALKMKPIQREVWETVFDRRNV